MDDGSCIGGLEKTCNGSRLESQGEENDGVSKATEGEEGNYVVQVGYSEDTNGAAKFLEDVSV